MKNGLLRKEIIFAGILLLSSYTLYAGIIYVNFAAQGNNDGSSWTNAFTQLQPAISAAVTGDEIWVAAGTYKPTIDYGLGSGTRGYHFRLKNGVGIYGGFNGTETNRQERISDPNLTILSGDLSGNDNNNIDPAETTRQDNCYHVFYHPSGYGLNNTAVLDGFTITAGNANQTTSHNSGGGMYNYGSNNPILNNCIFWQNTASSHGGGIYNYGSNPAIVRCNFNDNTAGWNGGGLHNYNSNLAITNCIFHNNSACGGGGIFNNGGAPAIRQCTFDKNITQQGYGSPRGGAGIYNLTSIALITDCIFNENNATYPDTQIGDAGGGILNEKNSNATIARCIFTNNSARFGGGIENVGSSPTIADCTFLGNFAVGIEGQGGGIDNIPYMVWCGTSPCPYYLAEPIITNCVFENNFATGGSGPIRPCGGGGIFGAKSVTNCIFNNNSSYYGGGVCYADTVTNCIFNENTATAKGGSIYSASEITDCIFNFNEAGDSGGAIASPSNYIVNQTISRCSFNNNIVNSTSNPCCGGAVDICSPVILTITHCSFNENEIIGPDNVYGGAIYSAAHLILTNCIFKNNTVTGAYSSGGGVYNANELTVINCLFFANIVSGSAIGCCGGLANFNNSSSITNCIFWDNMPTNKPQLCLSSTSLVSYSNVQGGYIGVGNIDVDPNFVDPVNGDLRLQSYSPCVDSGDNAAVVSIPTDLIGSSRIIDGDCNGLATVDMGAYEYYLPGDLDTTCGVDFNDLTLWIAHWLQQECTGPDNCGQADINRNGIVEMMDFALLAQAWQDII